MFYCQGVPKKRPKTVNPAHLDNELPDSFPRCMSGGTKRSADIVLFLVGTVWKYLDEVSGLL